MLDVVDAHRIREHFLARSTMVRCDAQHRIQVHREQVEFGISAQIEPMLPRHQREITAGIGVDESSRMMAGSGIPIASKSSKIECRTYLQNMRAAVFQRQI